MILGRRRRGRRSRNNTQNNTTNPRESMVHSETQQSQVVQSSNSADFRFEGGERIHYLEGLISKQLELYTWCEEKVTTLATIDSILLAGATLFVEHVKTGDFPVRVKGTFIAELQMLIENNFPFIMVLFIILPIFISLGISLWHVIPKMRSGATPNAVKNHRSSSGIHKYKNIPEYKSRLDSITESEIYEDIVRQIYGMNIIVWKNQISIKVAVYFDLAGLLGFFCIMLYLMFNGNSSSIFN